MNISFWIILIFDKKNMVPTYKEKIYDKIIIIIESLIITPVLPQ